MLIESIKEEVSSVGIDIYNSKYATNALKDVILLLTHLYINHSILKCENITDTITNIVLSGEASLLAIARTNNEIPENAKCNCCLLI